MIDLHSHILPGIDDGAKNVEVSLEMARIAVNDGIKILACTPHITPPRYNNDTAIIKQMTKLLRKRLDEENIDLALVMGADIHIDHDILESLQNKTAPALHDTKYFLFEPPHHVAPPNIDRFCAGIISEGYIPVLTHPERLTWIENHYDIMTKLDELGLVIQLTAGSITGNFGSRPQYWSERFLAEGRVDIIASDAHDTRHRPPIMSKARDIIAATYGDSIAQDLTLNNPLKILHNENLPVKNRIKSSKSPQKTGITSLFGRLKGLK